MKTRKIWQTVLFGICIVVVMVIIHRIDVYFGCGHSDNCDIGELCEKR